jgi:hypothetical protein
MRNINNQKGNSDPLLIPLIATVVLLLGFAGFAVWSYTNYLDASKVEQAEIDEAVEASNAKLTEELEIAFAEREKIPTRVYTTPQSSGSVEVTYPKTWSVYAEEDDVRGTLESYLHPNYVRNIDSEEPIALRVTVNSESYSRLAEKYAQAATKGTVTVKATEVSGVTGIRVDGNIVDEFEGALVAFPLRDKTLTVWTENKSYLTDFNDIVIKNLKFVP